MSNWSSRIGGIRSGLFGGFMLALTLLPGPSIAGDALSGGRPSVFPPPPGPYQPVPPAALNNAAAAGGMQPGAYARQMHEQHEGLVKQRNEAMRARRQEMIQRYQTMRQQGFHAEREEAGQSAAHAGSHTEPAWVEERRKQLRLMREKNEAAWRAHMKASEVARNEAEQYIKKQIKAQNEAQARALNSARAGLNAPTWRPMPPLYPRFYARPYPSGMGWRPHPRWVAPYPPQVPTGASSETAQPTKTSPGSASQGSTH